MSRFEIAFGALGGKTFGNSSSETAALGSLTEPLQKRADEVGAKAGDVEAIVRDIGVDPMTLPVELALRIREEVQEANVASLRHLPARAELLREAVHYELRDAGLASAAERTPPH